MNKILYLCFFCPLLLILIGCKSTVDINGRTETFLNKNWYFQQGVQVNESEWEQVHLPHTPKIEPLVVNDQWQGVSWYKKPLLANKLKNDQNHFLKFEGVMQEATVWVNGTLVKKHFGGYLPFVVDLTDHITHENDNEILIKVVNTDNPTIPPGKPLKDLDFNTYGGIYRNVHLISTNKTYITDAVAAQKVNGGGVLVHFDSISKSIAKGIVKIHVKNTSSKNETVKALVTFLDHNGNRHSFSSPKVVVAKGTDKHIVQSVAITDPTLWSPDAPNLYAVDAQIVSSNNTRTLDQVHFKTGIRKIELNKNGFFLNGKKQFITGTNRHQEYPYVGYAISDNANYRDAFKIKQAGFDFVRLSHYPQTKSFLNACDELGLMVMNCIPGWQFFEEGAFEENAYKDIRDFIRNDRNHPSVIFWENSLNESGMSDAFMQNANRIAKEELPYDDIYTAGWLDHPSYDLFIPARQHNGPPFYWNNYSNNNRKIFIAEYGDWEYYAHNAGFHQKEFKNLKSEERTSRQLRAHGEKRLLQQALNYQDAFNSNLKGAHTIGHANWLMFDYNRGYADDLEASGISDIFRIPKFAYYFYKSQKTPKKAAFSDPMVYIANHWNKQSSLSVKVYSNCEEVALYLNDTLIGKQKGAKNHFSDALKHPPIVFNIPTYQKGTLTAKGFIKDKVVATHRVTTALEPARLQLEIDTSGKPLASGEDDMVFLYAKILDKNNTLVKEATNEVTFLILENQQAKIIGPQKINAEAGVASALLRTHFTNDKIVLNAKAKNLAADTLKIFTTKSGYIK